MHRTSHPWSTTVPGGDSFYPDSITPMHAPLLPTDAADQLWQLAFFFSTLIVVMSSWFFGSR
jgi:hypothetical protein